MGDVNLEIKLNNLDDRVIKIEESGGGGSGGDGYITSVSNDFNVVNKKLFLSSDITTKLSNAEDITNKVTTLDSTSTNIQYPSAKCVYDLVGDVESLLASL